MTLSTCAMISTANRYQNFNLRDEESMLINGVIIKQSLVDQVLNTAHSVVPNNFVEVGGCV